MSQKESCGCERTGRCIGQRCPAKSFVAPASAEEGPGVHTFQEFLDDLDSGSDRHGDSDGEFAGMPTLWEEHPDDVSVTPEGNRDNENQ